MYHKPVKMFNYIYNNNNYYYYFFKSDNDTLLGSLC